MRPRTPRSRTEGDGGVRRGSATVPGRKSERATVGSVDMDSLLVVPSTAPRFVECTTRWPERPGMSLRRYPNGDCARTCRQICRVKRKAAGREPVSEQAALG